MVIFALFKESRGLFRVHQRILCYYFLLLDFLLVFLLPDLGLFKVLPLSFFFQSFYYSIYTFIAAYVLFVVPSTLFRSFGTSHLVWQFLEDFGLSANKLALEFGLMLQNKFEIGLIFLGCPLTDKFNFLVWHSWEG